MTKEIVEVELINVDQQVALINPKEEELNKLVSKTKKITAKDLEDAKQIEVVSTARKELKKARVELTNLGKSIRDNFTVVQKAIRKRELELIAIIEPEEQRLIAIEQEAKVIAHKKAMLEIIPAWKERLEAIMDNVEVEDDYLLGLDHTSFEVYYNSRVAGKNERDQFENERIQRENDQLMQEEISKEKARLEIERAELKEETDRLKEESDKIEKQKQELQDELIAKKKEEEDQEAAKQISLKKKEYIEFRASLGYTKENSSEYREENTGDSIIILKEVGVFNLK